MKGKALILGASGFVGRPLGELLLARGWRVHGAARFGDEGLRRTLAAAGIETLRFDLTRDDPARLPDVDVVFFEVWDRSHHDADAFDEIFALNYDAVGRVAARYAGRAHLINGSTISLYGRGWPTAPTEHDAPRPHNDYALSRFAQEKLFDFLCAQAGHSRAIHLRYCRSNKVERGTIRRFAELVHEGASLGANPDELTQVIAVEDFVRCTVAAGERVMTEPEALPPVVNIVHPRVWTVRELAERLRQEMGTGTVCFARESGGREASIWASAELMIETFGAPVVELDDLIARIAHAVAAR